MKLLATITITSLWVFEFASTVTAQAMGDRPLVLTRDEKTVICPESAQNLHEGHIQYGMRTRFLVKNTASDPVVVAYVNEDGSEVSAANFKISPPQLDPESVMAPGEIKLFGVQEGHVFHLRDAFSGELLMQHRAGLVPIENRYNHEIDCPSDTYTESDIPEYTEDFRILRKFQQWKPIAVDTSTQGIEWPVGFHNTIVSKDGAQCPVNLYFVKRQDQNPRRKPNYVERFSAHLGTHQLSTGEEEAPNAAIKYETTYAGHQFAVRLAHDESVVVDYINMAAIQVADCSNKKKTDATIKSAAHASAVIIPVGAPSSVHTDIMDRSGNLVEVLVPTEQSNDTKRYFHEFVNRYNSTEESRRGLYFQIQYTE